ncbi:hypothetical protein ACE41R_11165 [Alteromonas macleodii]|uniref:J domain-containing protein n=1 Tax=Alteromonas macleodii TaxID=28108 RepID=UPI0031401211
MTTFNEILGTTHSSARQEVKKRYKLLSSKCHPDKGGSNGLFRLVKLAFEMVNKGLGDKSISQHQDFNENTERQLKIQIALLNDELVEQKSKNQTLSQELRKSELKNSELETEIQEQNYKIAALERQFDSKKANSQSSSSTHFYILVAVAIILVTIAFIKHSRKIEELLNQEPIVQTAPLKTKSVKDIYTLHIGSFRHFKNVKALEKKLLERGYQVEITTDQELYIVMLSLEVAQPRIDEIIDDIYSITSLRPKIVNNVQR